MNFVRKVLRGIEVGVAIALVMTGCVQSGKPTAKKQTNPTQSLQPQAIGMKSGSVTAYTKTGPRLPLYRVRWQSAQVSSSSTGTFSAVAQNVTGEIMKQGIEVSQFTADSAIVDRKLGTLKIAGRVKITQVNHGEKPGAVLTCQEVNYADSDQIIKAEGNVQVRTSSSSLSGLPAVWATPDFSEIGSPDTGFHH